MAHATPNAGASPATFADFRRFSTIFVVRTPGLRPARGIRASFREISHYAVRVTWLVLTIASALLLGLYDYFKKSAVQDNAVIPVLTISASIGTAIWLPFVIWSACSPETLPSPALDVCRLDARGHGLLLAKALLVGFSWYCGYRGIRTLPLSIAAPIRATAPLWTILLAVMLFGESPTARQWAGVGLILVDFFMFSRIGKREGIHFHRDTGVWFMIAATISGAVSALYDKYLLQNAAIPPGTVQAWFSIYLMVPLLPALALWKRSNSRHPFQWRWSILAIGITLIGADLLYFTAIAEPGALISLISPVRRTSVIVSFLLGIFLFGEKNLAAKSMCIAGIIAGVVLLA